jgi:hypothetical protein
MSQSEYRIFSGAARIRKAGQSIDWSAVEQQVNGLIADGWEVVSANAHPYGLLVFGCGSQEALVTFVLRRPRQS